LFANTSWSEINIEELNKNLERAMEDQNDRFDLDSPDSGVDFDMESPLLGMNDPIFSHFDNDFSRQTEESVEEVISLDLPVIESEVTEQVDFNAMESVMEENEGGYESDEECSESNYSHSTHPTELHSYSILKVSNTQSMKSNKIKDGRSFAKNLTNCGQRFKISMSQKKRKLYEMGPLTDPSAERNRLNALNAKKNRDKKKAQLTEAEEEIQRLRSENEDLRTEAEEVKDELEEARQELRALKEALKLQHGSHHSSLLGNDGISFSI